MAEQAMALIGYNITNTHVRTLNEYFYKYDCYVGRLLDTWELEMMFNITPEQAKMVAGMYGDSRHQNKILFDAFV